MPAKFAIDFDGPRCPECGKHRYNLGLQGHYRECSRWAPPIVQPDDDSIVNVPNEYAEADTVSLPRADLRADTGVRPSSEYVPDVAGRDISGGYEPPDYHPGAERARERQFDRWRSTRAGGGDV